MPWCSYAVVAHDFPGRPIHVRARLDQHGLGTCLVSDAAIDRAARSGIHDVTRGVPLANGRAGWVGQPAGDPIGDPTDLSWCFDLRGPQGRKVGRILDQHRGVAPAAAGSESRVVGPHHGVAPAAAASESPVVGPLVPGLQHRPRLVPPGFDVGTWQWPRLVPPRFDHHAGRADGDESAHDVDGAAGALADESAHDAGGGGAGSRMVMDESAHGLGALCSTVCLE